MLRIALLVALASLFGLQASAAAQSRLAPDAAARLQEGLTATADGFILPAYQDQADAAGSLTSATESLCAGEAKIGLARQAFADLFLTWQRASLLQIGPILDAEGPMRVQLWPDPKGFSRRAVRAALKAEDPALVAPGGLAGRSIALSNLTALEDLLYGVLEPRSYACALAHAIARHQADLADTIVEAWTPGHAFRAAFDTAAAGNDRYGGVEPLVRETLAGAVVHVDRLRKFKLSRGLGDAPGEARAERTEARASGLGLASIAASFRALADLYAVPFGLFDVAPELGGAMDYLSLGQTAATVADTWEFVEADLAAIATEDGADAAQLRELADAALRHEAFLKTRFPEALGLVSGFTTADGD